MMKQSGHFLTKKALEKMKKYFADFSTLCIFRSAFLLCECVCVLCVCVRKSVLYSQVHYVQVFDFDNHCILDP